LRARSRQNRVERFWKIGFSGLLRYLGSPSPRILPPKATRRPSIERIGKVMRLRKRS
jgi:hypothetical protein